MAQFNPPPPKQPLIRFDGDASVEERQFNPPPPKQERQTSVEEEDFMAPMINENGHFQVDDMVFTEGQYKYHYGNEEEQRQAHPSATTRWSNNVMPYAFDGAVSASNRAKINEALKDLNHVLKNCAVVK